MTTLVRIEHEGTPRWAVRRDGSYAAVPATLAELLSLPLEQARAAYEGAGDVLDVAGDPRLLAPVDEQEVWAAGVTYQRSRQGRVEESAHASMYDHVYDGQRPEIFFKATPARVVADGDPVGIRADSGWDVPEPEVGLVVNSRGEVFGYLVANDMSSRSIEGENPLFLPQAKCYTAACALGPGIVPVWEAGEGPFPVSLRIARDGETVFEGATSTATMRRTFPELVSWLTRAMDFPVGAVLLTGTGIVPEAGFTLRAGDRIDITVDGIGAITNTVTVVGR